MKRYKVKQITTMVDHVLYPERGSINIPIPVLKAGVPYKAEIQRVVEENFELRAEVYRLRRLITILNARKRGERA